MNTTNHMTLCSRNVHNVDTIVIHYNHDMSHTTKVYIKYINKVAPSEVMSRQYYNLKLLL